MAQRKNKNTSTAKKVAMGAAGMAVVSGVVAGAAMLADKPTRSRLASEMGEAKKKVQDTAVNGYQTVYHQVDNQMTNKRGRKNTASRKNSKKKTQA